jgi:flagellar FliL protein
MSAKEKTVEAEETAGGGKKKLLLIGLVVLLAAAGAAYFFLFPGSAEADTEPVAGDVLVLEPIAVNLAGGGYLKIGVTLQFTEEGSAGGGHGAGGPDGSKATDLIISTFSQAAPADVTGAREALKVALEKKIIEAYHGDVMEIFYNEYVTQ